MNDNFYEDKIKEIKSLINKNNIKAIELLSEELKMPYVPQVYEKQFVDLHKKLLLEISNNSNSNPELSQDRLIEYLWSTNELIQAIAIDNLSKINLRNIQKELQKWFHESKALLSAKAYVYEMLVEQQININLIIDEISLNPVLDKSILDYDESRKAFSLILKNTEKDPSLQELALSQLQLYILKSFPQRISDSKVLSETILKIVNSMFSDSIILTSYEEQIKKLLES